MAAPPVLVVSGGGATRQFTSDELLVRHDAATLAASNDPAYGGAASYRAVPLRALLPALPSEAGDTIQARATDGFVAELPHSLIDGMATPWIAVEDPVPSAEMIDAVIGVADEETLVILGRMARTEQDLASAALAALEAIASPRAMKIAATAPRLRRT